MNTDHDSDIVESSHRYLALLDRYMGLKAEVERWSFISRRILKSNDASEAFALVKDIADHGVKG
jgi:hypothetical protein